MIRIFAALLAVLLLAAGFPNTVSAATFTVTKLADTNDGACYADCSLREAIAAAASGDTVTFAPGLTGVITLSLGQISIGIDKNLTIQGPGAGVLSISGGGASYGGAIFNSGSLTIRDITFSGNYATLSGGAIYNAGGSLTITNSTLSGNSANHSGGAIYNRGGSLTITNSTFSGNSGIGNVYGGGGGAIYGGYTNVSGSLTITNSTFSGNRAYPAGGAIRHESHDRLTITNSTFSGNSTAIQGGAIWTYTASLGNNIIAGNTAQDGPDIFGWNAVTSRGHNLVGTSSPYTRGLTNGVNGDLVGVNPLLGPLANNGGATATHALLPGSPAIDAGDYAMCAAAVGSYYGAGGLEGMARPQGARCDIGAFLGTAGVSAGTLLDAGVSVSDLLAGGYSAVEALLGGATASELQAAGVTATGLIAGGATASQMLNAGFSPSALLAAGATASQLKAAGVNATALTTAGVSLADLVTAGFTQSELLAAGYTAVQVLAGGATAAQLTAAGFTAGSLITGGATAAQLTAAGVTAGSLITGGATVSQMLNAGFSPSQILAGGGSIADLKAAGVGAMDLRAAGVSLAVPALPAWALIALAVMLARLTLRAPRRASVRVRR